MIGESKPNFALDLSNDGVALWNRASGGGWKQLGNVRLDDPEFSDQLNALREQAIGGAGSARARRAIIRIPRSEVLLSKVRVGVFEGEAAFRHARKQVAELTPYTLEEISFDLGDKGVGNMAPVGIVALKTLDEAEAFAKSHGFTPAYFTTQYSEKEFPREPRFFATPQAVARKPMWFVPWVAAASIGLTIGYFGYSYFNQPTLDAPVQVAQTAPAAEPTPAPKQELEPDTDTATQQVAAIEETNPEPADTSPTDTVQLGLQDIAPNLPPVLATLAAPQITDYPEMRTSAVTRSATTQSPKVVRLQITKSDQPEVTLTSKQVKTNNLQIAEARRDLPEVSINEDIARLIEENLAVLGLSRPAPAPFVRTAALTAPDQVANPLLVNPLPAVGDDTTPVNATTTVPADRPPPPVSLVTAEPGTLTPTPEGTLGPGNILIYSGAPPNPPLARPGTVAPPPEPVDPLAGFRPRLRPDSIAPQQIPTVEPEPVEPPTILALADPSLRGFRARPRPDGLVPEQPETTETEPEAPTTDLIATAIQDDAATQAVEDAIAQDTAQQAVTDTINREAIAQAIEDAVQDTVEPSLLARADPSLRGFTPRIRPASLAPEPEIAQDTAEPDTDPQAFTLLALADPTLVNKRSRVRPSGLRIVKPEPLGLLALADRSLANKKSRNRPRSLRILALAKPEPDPEPEATPEPEGVEEPTNTLSSATKLAIARSPVPKRRPAKLARVAKRVTASLAREQSRSNTASNTGSNTGTGSASDARSDSSGGIRSGGSTRATAKTPRSAVGSSKPSPSPTTSTVARAATEKSKFRKSRLSLVGVFGTPSKRRALVRLPTGRYVKVQKGDKISGWQISAIGESSLRIKKGSRDQVLRMP